MSVLTWGTLTLTFPVWLFVHHVWGQRTLDMHATSLDHRWHPNKGPYLILQVGYRDQSHTYPQHSYFFPNSLSVLWGKVYRSPPSHYVPWCQLWDLGDSGSTVTVWSVRTLFTFWREMDWGDGSVCEVLSTPAWRLEFDPQDPHNSLGVMVCAIPASTGEEEQGRFLGFSGQPA